MRDRESISNESAMIDMSVQLWPGLKAQDRVAAAEILAPHQTKHAAGEIFQIEGDRSDVTYAVLQGWAALSKSLPDGERQILDLMLPGDFLDPRAANHETSTIELEAITDAVIVEINDALWAKLDSQVPQFQELRSRSLAGALTRMLERMLRLGKADAEARIAHAIVELWIRLSAIGLAHDQRIALPLTQKQLGEFVGLTSVHISRITNQLASKGVLQTDTQMTIAILDLTELASLAGTDTATLATEIIPKP